MTSTRLKVVQLITGLWIPVAAIASCFCGASSPPSMGAVYFFAITGGFAILTFIAVRIMRWLKASDTSAT